MSYLTNLPEEILIIIIKQLDIKSIYNLYKTCRILKNIIIMKGIIRRCNLSCNTLSTSKSLQLDMIKQISGHLYELNMCGVSNLRKSMLLPALGRMKCLKTLDVSYTEITIYHVLAIYRSCSTIKNITINFLEELESPEFPVHEYEEVLKNFINVHLIVHLRWFNLSLKILRKSLLDTLKFTLYGLRIICHETSYEREEIGKMISYKHLCMFMVYHKTFTTYGGTWKDLLPWVNMEEIEFIIIKHNNSYSVCVSSLFKSFFSENFSITTFDTFDCNTIISATDAIFIWNKKTTMFDELFYFNLKIRIKQILQCKLNISSEPPLQLGINTLCYEWFYINPPKIDLQTNKSTNSDFKRRRIVQSNHVLDYDELFREHKTVKLHIHFSISINVTLSSRMEFLGKLTYLSLSGPFVRYSNEFFNILFRCCKSLITLNVEASSLSTCSSSIMRSIPLSQSLKNIRLVGNEIDFKTLFSSFAQCKALENISITDSSLECNELADLAILYKCVNLYNLHINVTMKKSTMMRMNSRYKNLLKNESDRHLNFILESSSPINSLSYNPYFNVFNLEPIKPV